MLHTKHADQAGTSTPSNDEAPAGDSAQGFKDHENEPPDCVGTAPADQAAVRKKVEAAERESIQTALACWKSISRQAPKCSQDDRQ